MKYEMKKFLSHPAIVLLLAALVFVNGYLYYGECTGTMEGYSSLTMQDVKEKYEDYLRGEDLRAECELWNALLFEGDAELTDEEFSSLYQELVVNEAVLARVDEAENYQTALEEIKGSYVVMLRINGITDPDSYAYRMMYRFIEVYEALSDVEPEVSFSGGIEILSGWRISDVFLVLFALVAGLILVYQDRSKGYLSLLRPMKKGHAHLYIRKFLTMLVIMLIGGLLIYGINYGITAILFGYGELSRPLQSVYGFSLCPLHLTVGGYLACFLLCKLLWAAVVGTVVFALCGFGERLVTILVLILGVGALSVFMGMQENLWLRSFSLVFDADVATFFQSCFLLNLFSWPVWQLGVILVFWVMCLVAFGCLGLALHCKRFVVVTQRPVLAVGSVGIGLHTRLAAHERRKLLGMQGGAAALAVLICLQTAVYLNFDSADDIYYQEYAEVLAGLPSEEKDAFLAEEALYFDEIYEQINYYSERYADDDWMRTMIVSSLQNKLVKEQDYERAKLQYEGLEEGEEFVYDSGYLRLYNSMGKRDSLLNTAKLFAVLVAVFSGLFAVEYETGMQSLLTTSGQVGAVRKRKCMLAILFLLAGMVIAYLPQYVAVSVNYGLPQLSAAAGSISLFYSYPDWLPLWGVLVLAEVKHLLTGVLALAAVLFLSEKTKDSVMALLISTVVLLLPLALIYIFGL